MARPELSMQALLVVRELLLAPSERRYGLELSDAAGLKPGTVYAILARLERMGWLRSSTEDIDPVKAGRPPRRLYELSASGAPAARAALTDAVAALSLPSERPKLARPLPGMKPA